MSQKPDLVVQFPEDYPDLYDDMGQVVAQEIYALGFPAENAKAAAFRIMDTIRKEFGGTSMYLPKCTALDLKPRDQEIFNKFNGRNYYELAREYNLSVIQIRNICNRGLAKMRANTQHPLFETKPDQ